MTKKEKITRSCIKQGDFYYQRVLKDFTQYQQTRKFLTNEELLMRENLISSNIALACEYYLKGIFMQEKHINLSDEMKRILIDETGSDKLLEDEEIALIKGDDIEQLIAMNPTNYRRLDILRRREITINGRTNKALNFLRKDLKRSAETFYSIGHDLSVALDKLPHNVIKKIVKNDDAVFPMLPLLIYEAQLEELDEVDEVEQAEKYRNLLETQTLFYDDDINEMARVFSDILNQYNFETLITSEPNGNFVYSLTNIIEEFKLKISDSKVKDAFPKGRYGALNSTENDCYKADIYILVAFMKAINKTIQQTVNNAILINNKGHIFPDKNSNICVYDNNYGFISTINYNRFRMQTRRKYRNYRSSNKKNTARYETRMCFYRIH